MEFWFTPRDVAGLWVVVPWQIPGAIILLAATAVVAPRIGRWVSSHVESSMSLLAGSLARRIVQALGLMFALDVLNLLTIGEVAEKLSGAMDIHLFEIGDKPVTIGTGAMVLLFFLGSLVFSGRVQHWMVGSLEKQGMKQEGPVAVGTRLVHYLIVLTGLGIGLQTAGVDLTSLFTAGAVFAIGIGFAVQNLTQNFVSGVLLLVEGAIRPGDVLMLEGSIVRVSQMNLRATVVRNLDDAEIIVPNSTLVSGSVVNLTMTSRTTRVRVMVGVTYDCDPREVVRVLLDVGERFADRSNDDPVVLLRDFGSSSVDFELSVWTTDPHRIPRISSALRLDIWYALKEADMVIAFPQVDVHFDSEVVQRLGVA